MKNPQTLFLVLTGLLFIGTTISGQKYDSFSRNDSSDGIISGSSAAKKDSVTISRPPANKRIGVGINPLRSIANIGYELQLRGAVSFFAIDRHAEVSFPFQYIYGKDANVPYRAFFSEATYRRFFRGQQKGFYISAGVRYAYIEGELLDPSKAIGSPEGHTGTIFTQSKIGIYGGIGYRHFTKRSLYWGCNIIAGDYFGARTPYITKSEDFPLNFILGCDLLEIGFAF